MQEHWRTLQGFTRVGSTGKVRGREGEIKLYVEEHFLPDVLEAEFLFIEANGNKVPQQVEHIRELQDLLVKFVGIENPEAATQWASAEVFLPDDEISSGPEETKSGLEYQGLRGYEIKDKTYGNLGKIREVREFPQQEMAVLEVDGKEILIPLNPVFLIDIDQKKKTVLMSLPEGLMDL